MATGEVAMAYTRAAMERAMKVADVLLHALKERTVCSWPSCISSLGVGLAWSPPATGELPRLAVVGQPGDCRSGCGGAGMFRFSVVLRSDRLDLSRQSCKPPRQEI